MKKTFLAALLMLVVAASPAAASRTVSATIGWTESDPSAVACRLYVYDADGNPVQVGADVVLPASSMLVIFSARGDYVLVATALNALGLESDFSLPLTVRATNRGVREL